MSMHFFVFILLTSFSSIVFANTLLITGQFGLGKANTGGSSTIRITTDETDRLQSPSQTLFPQFSIGVGYQLPCQLGWQQYQLSFVNNLSLFINLRYIQTELTGEVYQYQDPAMNNYDYNISIDSTRLMLNGIFNFLSYKDCLHFYVLGGIGTAWTRVDYDDASLPGIVGGSLSLESHLNNAFVYELGVGFHVPYTTQIYFSLEYLYAHFKPLDFSQSGKLNGAAHSIVRGPHVHFATQTLSLGFMYQL